MVGDELFPSAGEKDMSTSNAAMDAETWTFNMLDPPMPAAVLCGLPDVGARNRRNDDSFLVVNNRIQNCQTA